MRAPAPVSVIPITGMPEVRTGDDLGGLLATALTQGGLRLTDGDVLVVSSKVVSKALGLRAQAAHRTVLVATESDRVVCERATTSGVTRIVHTHAGPTLAGAGIDASNVGPAAGTGEQADTVLLLPRDPDEQAARLRAAIARAAASDARFGVVLSDTAGRPWRSGQIDYALGASGVRVVDDLRGDVDADGRPLHVTIRALADEIASAADLVKGKSHRVAAALVRGLDGGSSGELGDLGAAALIRTEAEDWFELGTREAVLSALGIPPASPASQDVGLPMVAGRPVAEDGLAERVERACRAALHPSAYAALHPEHPRARQQRENVIDGVTAHVVQSGVRIEAPDEFTLGLVVARLVVALAAEHVPATPAATHVEGPGAQRQLLGLPAATGAVGMVLFT